MEEVNEILRNNRTEDVSWLCSLSESELDFLISIKLLVLQRAKVIGHDDLAKKFDLKTLRAIAFVLMENIRGRMKNSTAIHELTQGGTPMDGCNLLNCNMENVMSIEELMASVGSDERKRHGKRRRQKAASGHQNQGPSLGVADC